jgi:hypothetical protein
VTQDLIDTRNDPYAAYGAKVGSTGQFLSFKNGEYVFGQNAEELPIGTRLVANMPGLRIGWRRWFGGQVTDDMTMLLADGPTVERRDALGDMDQSKWDKDDLGEPRDPWQMTNILELSDGEKTFLYSTSSRGGIGAIGRLCKDYGRQWRMRPNELPIIELARDSYMHPRFKKIYVPDFKIVGWTDADNPSVNDAELAALEPMKEIGRQRDANPTLTGPSAPTTSRSNTPRF